MSQAASRLKELRAQASRELIRKEKPRYRASDVRCAIGLTLDTAIKEGRVEEVARVLADLLARPRLSVYAACKLALGIHDEPKH